ncbi:MAG: DUF3419 family protein [Bradymonadia bacterium]
MKNNPIQFAIVREDPQVELRALDHVEGPAHRALIIASGGCTALTLAGARPEVHVTALDPNPTQLDLVRRKIEAVRRGDLDALGLWADQPERLSHCGNFESLFRSLRRFVFDLVCPEADIRAALEAGEGQVLLTQMQQSAYWPVAFQMHFHDALLKAMFGPAAIQYAPRGSYPTYFQQVVEAGLQREDARINPWLHHVLLGHYLPDCAPAWTQMIPAGEIDLHQGDLTQVDFTPFDLVHLSNVFDWMAPEQVRATTERLHTLRPGAVVTLRQLNNDRDLAQMLPGFDFDPQLDDALRAADRSLFYTHIRIGRRR